MFVIAWFIIFYYCKVNLYRQNLSVLNLLLLTIHQRHHPKTINCFSLEDIATILAPYETVRRSRQTIQNTLGLYPCDKKVKGRRRQSEETMRQWVQNKLTPAQTKKILAEYLNTK